MKYLIYKSLFLAAFVLLFNNFVKADSWKVETKKQWKQLRKAYSAIYFEDDTVCPSIEKGYYTSKVKRFDKKMSAKSITISQSAVWENWKPVKNLGPDNFHNAPVMLILGQDNYWMFGQYVKIKGEDSFKAEAASLDGFDVPLKTTPLPNVYNAPGGLKKGFGGYHAWQSRDMKNWVHHGPVTKHFSRWVTTAEYSDGKAYIYYDYPNDQDPHLYIDDDLTDGEPGKNMGLAFADPSDGSDCAFFRDKEGSFHVIYEDWSPINASKHSWDSPLAGHAVSKNGITDFEILDFAVDNRTKPTGKVGEYKHPHWLQHPDWKSNAAKYNVHKPEQEAYGDWAMISIGEQYYLFGDFDPVGGHDMSVCWFTSDSLNKKFQWCGNIGKGHPDPDICFAEGQFYLVTQMDTDYVSPGPWVEKVTARVGADTDNDGEAELWTKWQEVKENYDYIEGFAKRIERRNASMDISFLPPAYGFCFEFKLEDTTENPSKPMIDSVEIEFE
ncbi:hypothetical protein L21SP3_01292 [Sedimentisphaera cyanobacteriorum]|uniref:Glycosyl hydrolases family 43 n=1 Tax=Sedimentisphaera cyanobacteriorum TaxID=1940790 RepID=A0A1Q2HPW2_9BACT|nr:hypothetical protein [Sedimentisphaera cyanobacteriorum]AQQ09487.1 hypothetical protein L21SP3_01292 [Sedimentisphaera cyanobacteriorum]